MLSETLDLLAVGIIVVDRNALIAHANRAARRLLQARIAIQSVGDRLAGLDRRSTQELRTAISKAAVTCSGENPYMPA